MELGGNTHKYTLFFKISFELHTYHITYTPSQVGLMIKGGKIQHAGKEIYFAAKSKVI